ncbi:MAG: hypothetical protein HRU19_15880 [Pseudobacteriovorax sp.]|nr:hypothetical protein [Pseudobacteriovorax sp.]
MDLGIFLGGAGAADGNYRVRASCSASAGSLIDQAIPVRGRNALTNKAIAWNTPEAVIIGGAGRIPLCFGNSATIEIAQAVFNSTGFQTLSGPSSAFIPVLNQQSHPSDITQINGSGLRCDESRGWRITGCYIHAIGTRGDISPIPNGCISLDHATSSLTVLCAR